MAAYSAIPQPLQGNIYPPPNAQPFGGMQAQGFNPLPSDQPPQPFGGMQIQGSSPLPSDQPHREALPSYIFLVLAAFVRAFSAVNLSLNYCGAWVSLEDIVSGGYSNSITHSINIVCDYPSYYSTCDHLCGNLKDFRSAGRVMLAFGIISMVLTCVAAVRFMMLLMRYPMYFKGLILKVAMVGGTAMWILGTIVYGGIYGTVHNEDKDSITGPGLELAIAIAVLQLVMCFIGMVGVNKLP